MKIMQKKLQRCEKFKDCQECRKTKNSKIATISQNAVYANNVKVA